MEFTNGRAPLEGRWEHGDFVWPQQLRR
jgi:hypothetical protein